MYGHEHFGWASINIKCALKERTVVHDTEEPVLFWIGSGVGGEVGKAFSLHTFL